MRIDPVIMLAEQLRSAEAALKRERERENTEQATLLLGRIAMLTAELGETTPSSALGAAELLGFAAAALPEAAAEQAGQLLEIAARLAMGQRLFADLVALRGLRSTLMNGPYGQDGMIAARMIRRAIAGAARPVVVYRAVIAPEDAEERILA